MAFSQSTGSVGVRACQCACVPACVRACVCGVGVWVCGRGKQPSEEVCKLTLHHRTSHYTTHHTTLHTHAACLPCLPACLPTMHSPRPTVIDPPVTHCSLASSCLVITHDSLPIGEASLLTHDMVCRVPRSTGAFLFANGGWVRGEKMTRVKYVFFLHYFMVFSNSPPRETPKNVIEKSRKKIGFGFLVDFFVKTFRHVFVLQNVFFVFVVFLNSHC